MAILAKTRFFDLTVGLGMRPSLDFYAETTVNGRNFTAVGPNLVKALYVLIGCLDHAGALPNTLSKSAPKSTARKKPSELTTVSHPNCQSECTSFDIFGAGKCKSMCPQRTGL